MPSSQGHQNTQRRVFRGRGRPKDGNLPNFAKRGRVKVKYHPPESSDPPEQLDEPSEEQYEEVVDLVVNESGANAAALVNDTAGSAKEEGEDNKFLLEIKHLQKRIQNVQSSIQTSQGLSNPSIWRTNCLMPVRNVVKEWRSILKFYSLDKVRNEQVDAPVVFHDNDAILHDQSQKVFGLIQMAVQTGPLVGSNPGYFKRCGGEVASIAFWFLGEIVELAGSREAGCSVDSEGEDIESENHMGSSELEALNSELENRSGGRDIADGDDDGCRTDNDLEVDAILNEGTIAEIDDEFVSDSSETDSDGSLSVSEPKEQIFSPSENVGDLPISNSVQMNEHLHLTASSLESALHFTEKQSHAICQWHQKAKKAMDANKPPSKTAKKLQSQKSKKQKQKDLKKERRSKKKGGRG